jgi:small subunit ribosomal protein S9
MSEDPRQPEQPEGGAPEDEAPEAAPGEPGEEAPPEPVSEAGDEAAPPPGPEVEGAEELAEAAAGREPQPEGEAPEEGAPEGEAAVPEGEAAVPEGEAAVPEGEAEEREEPGVPPGERPQPGRRRRQGDERAEDVIPGAHLEPDLVLEEQRQPQEGEYGDYDRYAEAEAPAEGVEGVEEVPAQPVPVEREPLDLAADARYQATGKRKSAVARVILRPGEGTYRINGRHLDEYFPRVRLQRLARQPLEAAGYDTRMDVVARIHGGGVSAQATALRHGVARALVEADPALRGELKGRGYLTRDPRVKERKKAGLKKARKRPQFSKR